jgi:hypothetical protein
MRRETHGTPRFDRDLSDRDEMKDERFEVLAHTSRAEMFLHDVETYSEDPVEGKNPLGSPWLLDEFNGAVTVGRSFWTKPEAPFTARPGQVNEWIIPLPEDLIKVVRQELERDENSKSK